MKKIIALFTSLSYLAIVPTVFAQDTVDTCPKDPPFNKLCEFTSGSFTNLVGAVITLLFIIAVVIALAFLIWGGIKWILSGGDKTAVESARNHIVAAIVGLVIVFLSYFIINIIFQFFFKANIGALTLPTFNP